jgi:hypothetical protein
MKKIQSNLNLKKAKASVVKKIPGKYVNSNEKWDEAMDENLEFLFFRKVSVKDLSGMFGRTPVAIRKRIKKLNLKEKLKNKLGLLLSGILIFQNEFYDTIINFV